LSRPPSLRRLLVQVVLLAAVLAGLSRLAGRSAKPPAGSDGEAPLEAVSSPARHADEMTTAPPDRTFYRTLGDARAPGGGPPVGPGRDEAPGRTPETSPSGGGAYVVQALATRDAAAARRVRDRLAARGFPATVSSDRAAARPVYRVRVGRYRTRAEAEAAARVLRQKHHLSPWILQEEE
jgi:cell division septation protein DedD